MTWVIDLDGVMWSGDEPIEGSAEAIETLRAADQRILFVTNNSFATVEELHAKFLRMGVAIEHNELLTAPQVLASMLPDRARIRFFGGPGTRRTLEQRGGIEIVDYRDDEILDPRADENDSIFKQAVMRNAHRAAHDAEVDATIDAVVVAWHDVTWTTLTRAYRSVAAGATLYGVNQDPTYPTQVGLFPGGGAILAAVAFAAQGEPIVAGKPNQPIADEILRRVGKVRWCIGDQPTTDGLLAHRLGASFGLVLSGAVSSEEGAAHKPAAFERDLRSLVESILQSSNR